MLSRFAIMFLILSALASCRDSNVSEVKPVKPGSKEMEDLNRYLVQKDRDRIRNYIERKNLDMTESPTGLWYQVIKAGEGELIRENMSITMEYECSLLDGTICYSSEETGPKSIVLGRTGIEPGLYEGLKHLRAGAEAVFIIPPFLAHGLPGDGKRIPPRSVIVYKVNILRAG